MRPLVIAHRGASAERPENTLAAFARAVELGADYVELDVHADREGTLVVTHDPPGARRGLPTLEEALEAVAGGAGAMVELKHPYRYRRHDVVRRTVELLGERDMLVSFEPRALEHAVRLRPGLRTIQHVGYGTSLRRGSAYAWGAGFDDARVTPRGLARAARLGLATAVYTVNDPERMRELASLGVGGIFTDRPGLLRQVLESLAQDPE
jgi:glycerophosphoryl diester phosphodiesterase